MKVFSNNFEILLMACAFETVQSLNNSTDDQWVHDRRFMNQFFTPKLISNYQKYFAKCADVLITSLVERQSNNSVGCDLLPLIEKCAVQGVCSTLFGMDLHDGRIDDIYAKTSEIFEA